MPAMVVGRRQRLRERFYQMLGACVSVAVFYCCISRSYNDAVGQTETDAGKATGCSARPPVHCAGCWHRHPPGLGERIVSGSFRLAIENGSSVAKLGKGQPPC